MRWSALPVMAKVGLVLLWFTANSYTFLPLDVRLHQYYKTHNEHVHNYSKNQTNLHMGHPHNDHRTT